jgi:hypothetical protein
LHVQTVDLADPGYRHLLRGYFDRALEAPRARLEAAAVTAGEAPEAARAAVAARLDALFPVLLDKADGLFLYFAFLLDRLRGRALAMEELEDLPRRDALYTDFLDTLGAGLAPKQADLARTLLLTLAALEQAHVWYLDGREPPFAVAPDWHGVPLDGLADLVGWPGVDGTLLYTLFSLRSVLGAWRGEAADSSSYRLGLKGLTAAIAGHPEWGPALSATHERLARETLGLLDGSDADGGEGGEAATPIGPARLRFGFAHAVLAGQDELYLGYLNDGSLTDRMGEVGHAAYERTRLAEAGRWYSLILLIHEARRQACEALEIDWPPAWGNDLAGTYMNRGMTQEAGQDPEAALADWALGRDLFAATLNRGYWPAGRGLLQCEAMTLALHTGRADWPRAAECLVVFLIHFGELEEGWPESGLSGEPPWRDVVGWCFGQLAALDPDQRVALLAALGDDAEQVKGLLDW